MPKVTILVPTYNRPHLARRALNSILAQTYKDYEILVVQNGSWNEMGVITDEFARRGAPVTFHFLSRAGLANAYNYGVSQARGELLAFLEDDDVWHPEKLAVQVRALEARPRAALVTCRSRELDEHGTLRRIRPESLLPCTFRSLVENDCVNVISSLSGVVMRRDAWLACGGLDTRYKISADVKLYLEIARRYECLTLNEALFDYSWHGGNLSSDLKSGWLEVAHIFKHLKPDAERGVDRALILQSISRYACRYYAQGSDLRDEHRYREAVGRFFLALRLDPAVGVHIGWKRFANPAYNLLKPYVLLVTSLAAGVVPAVSRWGRFLAAR